MKNFYGIGIGATIRIGREIQCLPYAGFFFTYRKKFHLFGTIVNFFYKKDGTYTTKLAQMSNF